jgi:hypothetical protein
MIHWQIHLGIYQFMKSSKGVNIIDNKADCLIFLSGVVHRTLNPLEKNKSIHF